MYQAELLLSNFFGIAECIEGLKKYFKTINN